MSPRFSRSAGRPGQGDGSAWPTPAKPDGISGTIREIYVESRQIPYGATLFYGYMDAQVQLADPAGANHKAAIRLHNYCGGYNAGMGRRDEAESCAAQLLLEGAQEMLARLNRDYFKAAPRAAIAQQPDGSRRRSLDKQLASVRAIAPVAVCRGRSAGSDRAPAQGDDRTRSGRHR